MAATTLTGPIRAPASGGAPRQLVVLLHGVGSDGNDLIQLAPYFAQVLPDAEFIAPDAPFHYDMAPSGHQWFSLQDRTASIVAAGARIAAPILDAFLDAELARRGLDDDALALVGFSQGTMMALHVGLRRPRSCAAVIGYSGALVAPESLSDEMTARPPVLLVHGKIDDVVPLEYMALAQETLQEAGVAVYPHIRPDLGHGIDADGIAVGAVFLGQQFAEA